MSAGTTQIQVDNTNSMTTGWAMQIGEVGQEQAEVVIGTPVAGGTFINCAATRYDHPADTPVYFTKYDQVVFEVSTAGTLGTAIPLANGTVTYTPDNFYTVFDDTAGSATYGYRTYFRNSALSVTTTESDWITFNGFSFYSLGRVRQGIRNKLWSSSFLTDDVLNEWINECKDKMANRVVQVNEDYAMGSVSVAFGTDGLGTITDPNFISPRRIWVTFDGQTSYQSTKMYVNDFIPNQIFVSVHPYHAWVDNNIFIVRPSDSTGTASVIYQRFGTTMVNDTDELPLPMRSYTDIFTDYCRAQALYKDNKFAEAESQMSRLGTAIGDFAINITPRDKTGPGMVTIVEPTTGETFY